MADLSTETVFAVPVWGKPGEGYIAALRGESWVIRRCPDLEAEVDPSPDWPSDLLGLRKLDWPDGIPFTSETFAGWSALSEYWLCGLLWCHKIEWDPGLPITKYFHRKLCRAAKPLGQVLAALVRIAEKCHFLGGEEASQYRFGSNWFAACARDVQGILLLGNDPGKRALVMRLREYSARLKDFALDLDGADSIDPFPDSASLTSLLRATKRNAAYAGKFRDLVIGRGDPPGLCPAWGALVSEIDTEGFAHALITEQGAAMQKGQGKGRIPIFRLKKIQPKKVHQDTNPETLTG
jgi:hypothetical protein